MLIRYYSRGCKTVQDVQQQLVKALTKGDCFRYQDEHEMREAKRRWAEQYAAQLIADQLDTLPPRVKREPPK